MTKLRKILVSSAADKVALILALKQDFSRLKESFLIVAGDMNEAAISFYFSDEKWIMPAIQQNNINSLIVGCKERGITHILPTRDGELLFYARNRSVFESEGLKVLVSNEHSVQLAMDKLSFSNHLFSLGFNAIRTYESIQDIENPEIVIKERYGSGSQRLWIGASRVEALKVMKQMNCPIVQPKIEGSEFSIDICLPRIQDLAIFSPRFRLKIVGGESKITELFADQILCDLAKQIVLTLGAEGVCVLQGFLTPSGDYVFNEINMRIGGATSASIRAGLPFVSLLVLDTDTDLSSNQHLLHNFKPILGKQVRASVDFSF
jgi:carbamoyl-phosphate synthase large subunit